MVPPADPVGGLGNASHGVNGMVFIDNAVDLTRKR
jgi:hypothetical protein